MGGQKPSKDPGRLTQPAGFNSRMCILSAIGICFVVFGHLGDIFTGVGTFYEWFPYYSFHLPLFLFITGYFFKDLNVRGSRTSGQPHASSADSGFWLSFLKFVWKKFRTLMIPFYIINGCMILFQLFLIGTPFALYPISFTDYLLMPWVYTQPYTFAIPTWYLAGLFISEVMYALLRGAVTALVKKKVFAEVLLLALTLAMGVAACYVVSTAQPSEAAIVYLRSVVMLFFVQAGKLYHDHLEHYDTLPSRWYFPILIVLQFVLLLISNGSKLNFGLYGLAGFGRTGIFYFIAGITGILLWLRISRLLDGALKSSRLVCFIGRNTKYIMSFHLLGFFALNLLLMLLHNQGIAPDILGEFDPEQLYINPFYFSYQAGGPRFILLYFLAGMGVSLLLAWAIEAVKHKLQQLRIRH